MTMTTKRNMCVTFRLKSKNFAWYAFVLSEKISLSLCCCSFVSHIQCLTVKCLTGKNCLLSFCAPNQERMAKRMSEPKIERGVNTEVVWDGEIFTETYVQCNANDRWKIEKQSTAKHFCHGLHSRLCLIHPTHSVCFVRSVTMTFCCFSWAFCTKELVSGWKQLRKNRTLQAPQLIQRRSERARERKEKKALKHTQSNIKKWHSRWTKSWHKQAGASGCFCWKIIFEMNSMPALVTTARMQ